MTKKIAGLYDKNDHLLVSWNELVDKYGFDIQKDILEGNPAWCLFTIIEENPELKLATKLIIDSSITHIGRAALSGLKLTDIIIPEGVTTIGDRAFSYSDLKNITIPSSITNMGYAVFDSCKRLTTVVFSDGVTKIGQSAFSYCYNLIDVIVPNSVVEIGDYAFYDCENLTQITIPISVTIIGKMAFGECMRLKEVIIQNSALTIMEDAFYSCRNLTDVIIGGKHNILDDISFCDLLCENEDMARAFVNFYNTGDFDSLGLSVQKHAMKKQKIPAIKADKCTIWTDNMMKRIVNKSTNNSISKELLFERALVACWEYLRLYHTNVFDENLYDEIRNAYITFVNSFLDFVENSK